MKSLHLLAVHCALFSAILLVVPAARAQLRIVDYNTTAGPHAGLETVLEGIGQEVLNGFAKPIDVLILQEQSSSATTTQAIVDLLTDLYGAGTYARATLDGGTNGAGRPGLIYNTTSIQLLDQQAFGTLGTSAQARQTLRYQLRPVGYDSAADFYVYSNHYKAGTSSSDEERRNVESIAVRSNLDSLGEGRHAILAGDYNIQSSSEASYQTLLTSGPGQAFDPVSRPGNWHDNNSFRELHTQAPAANPGPGFIGGGMDDRFDFQLVTGEFLDGEGLAYIPNSYRAFGNNGTHSLNGDLSTGTGASPAVLSALMSESDHVPVVADYQLPAVLNVITASIPSTLSFGQLFQLEITVRNVAEVLIPIGADELDYLLITSGDLSGNFEGVDEALGGSNSHLVTFDTSSDGLKSGTITVVSSSQGVANGLVSIPVSYQVIASALAGDYNQNGAVDTADYAVWRATLGLTGVGLAADGDGDNVVDANDYGVWRINFGETSAPAGDTVAVPEPTTVATLISAASILMWCAVVRVKLRANFTIDS